MLAFSTRSGGIPVVPACLDGWIPRDGYSLAHRDLGDGVHMVGIADPIVFDPPRRWFDLDESWRVGLTPGVQFDPLALTRAQLWCDTATARDLKARPWVAPVILDSGNHRAFRVSYGQDWLPALTVEQERCLAIAKESLEALAAGECKIAVACQWAAELLSATNHVTPQILGALGLIDDALVFSVLPVAVSRHLERAA